MPTYYHHGPGGKWRTTSTRNRRMQNLQGLAGRLKAILSRAADQSGSGILVTTKMVFLGPSFPSQGSRSGLELASKLRSYFQSLEKEYRADLKKITHSTSRGFLGLGKKTTKKKKKLTSQDRREKSAILKSIGELKLLRGDIPKEMRRQAVFSNPLPGRNFDYPRPVEGRMAKGYLWQAEQDARALREQLRDDDDIPGWTLVKMGTAADRLHTVHRYLGYKIAQSAKKNPEVDWKELGAGAGAITHGIAESGIFDRKKKGKKGKKGMEEEYVSDVYVEEDTGDSSGLLLLGGLGLLVIGGGAAAFFLMQDNEEEG